MISLENKKLEWLIKEGEENDEDLNFFRSSSFQVPGSVYETLMCVAEAKEGSVISNPINICS
jgi:hypothetical protein